MKRELEIFLTAVMYYTRIPVPKWVTHDPGFLSLATRYVPVIGWIVGGIYSAVIIVAMMLFPTWISIILGLIASVLLTGAFHEDGFADMCDGFGGGWTKEKILTIMKDSRVGTYGVVGIVLMLTLKIATTENLVGMTNWQLVTLLIASHSVSRLMSASIICFSTYAREDLDAKAKPVATGFSIGGWLVAIVFTAIPLLLFMLQTHWFYGLVLVPMTGITLYLSRYFTKWIGGYTGDCLGATQQINEVVFLLSVLAIWRSY
jgi:adenosylcobinamide-GDP ribazoletransferase